MSSFEKIPMGILDKVENNKQIFIAEFKDKLQEVFPSAVKDGILDFEALLNEFGKYAETDEKEKYNMTWVGKKEAIKTANEDIIGKTLKYVPEDSKDPETTQNIYIEGDNLEVLKLLRNSYYGKIKMIYIDPPYNTGNDFIYKDNFKINKEEYEKLEGSIDEYNERLTASKKGSGRYHSDWMNMMYPRLKIAKDLLKDDGVIFISIDDNEETNLSVLCNEIFGDENLVAKIPWQARQSIQNDTDISSSHEYILAYAKRRRSEHRRLKESNQKEWFNMDSFACYPMPLDKNKFSNPDNDPRGLWKADPFDAPNIRPNLTYEIRNINTGNIFMPPNGRCWRMEKWKYEKLLQDHRIIFGKSGESKPQLKVFYEEKKMFGSVENTWFTGEKVGTATHGTKELQKLFNGTSYFDTPKPTTLIKKLLQLSTKNNDIILDFFSGSATTAHSVIESNIENNENKRFIMVQIPELLNLKIENNEEKFKTICDIGRKRIDLAGEKIKEENKDKEGIENLDIGFKVFKVSDTNIRWISEAIKPNGGVEEKDIITQEELRENESYKDRLDFNPWFTDLDVVYEMMLKRQDIELTERIDKLTHIGDRTYLVGYTILVCLEENITEEMVRKISEIETSLSWIVFRDSAFDDDINLKTNTINLLRTLIKEKNPRNKNQKILWI